MYLPLSFDISLWETSQTLFWAIFGLVDLDNFELTGIKEFTRFFGLLMFGSFSVINIIVLLNLLIAMMNHSYQLISVSSVSSHCLFSIYVLHFWDVLNLFKQLPCTVYCSHFSAPISFSKKFSIRCFGINCIG